jgi:hypothetical protein
VNENFIAEVLSYSGDPAPAYEMLSQREQAFFRSIASDDALVAVLRGHLFVEADVNHLLEQLFPNASPLIDDLTYEQKIRRLRKATALPASIATLLKALGELRNAFAHSLDRSLTDADDARFYGALESEFRPGVDDMISRGAFPPAPGARVRSAIIVLHTGLSAMRLALKERQPPEQDS